MNTRASESSSLPEQHTKSFALAEVVLSGARTPQRLIASVMLDKSVIIYQLPRQGQVTIGRRSDAMLRIDHPSISRYHATLHVGADMMIKDVGSTNGVRVGGRTLGPNQESRVRVGEPMALGMVTMVVLPTTSTAATTTTSPPDRRDFEEVESNPLVELPTVPDETLASRIVVSDLKMVSLHALARRFAASDISVLLLGETGCGKEVLAEVIHEHSLRRSGPLLRLNCAELAGNLLESELFGYEKGAFSGATRAKPGLLEECDGGTIFLDELGEMPFELQTKLLRVIEGRTVRRIGCLKPRSIDVRFVAATNRDLSKETQEGRFRADLFYRLSGMSLTIPPLRERPSEIELLARIFVERFARELGRRSPPHLTTSSVEYLNAYSWPGNVRELRNVIQRSVLMSFDVSEIRPEHMLLGEISRPTIPLRENALGARSRGGNAARAEQATGAGEPSASAVRVASTAAGERERIIDALAQCAGNQTQAAKLLGIGRTKLVERLREYELPRPRKREAAGAGAVHK